MQHSHGFRRALQLARRTQGPCSLALTRPTTCGATIPPQARSTSLLHARHRSLRFDYGFSQALRARTRLYSRGLQTATAQKPPLRVAVIGSGPAGFYSARRLLQHAESVKVDMYEQLPVPFGLVRFGVAPDHPEVKNCEDTFAETAADSRFQFFGNINVGKDIDLSDLRDAYDAVLFAYGAGKDRELGIPGERAKGIYSARAFVGWYNGLPEYADLNPDLGKSNTAVVIGQGNVALDVARILLSDLDRLKSTDISSNALSALSKSTVKHVHVVGRRGLMQAACSIKELRELLQIPDVKFEPLQSDCLPESTTNLPRSKKRIADLMRKHSNTNMDHRASRKSWSLDFMLSPSAFITERGGQGQLTGVAFNRTRFEDQSEEKHGLNDPSANVLRTEIGAVIHASLAFRSIGYKSIAISGMDKLGISFDTRLGIVPNIEGRVISSVGEHIHGLYCTGWVKNGPTGVIATTMNDAFAAADTIINDWSAKTLNPSTTRGGWLQLSTKVGVQPVSWAGWLKIDREEKRIGSTMKKLREKFSDVNQMLEIAAGS